MAHYLTTKSAPTLDTCTNVQYLLRHEDEARSAQEGGGAATPPCSPGPSRSGRSPEPRGGDPRLHRGLPPRARIPPDHPRDRDRKSTRLNSSHVAISYA